MTTEIKIHFQKNIMHISMNIMIGSGHITLEHYLEMPADGEVLRSLYSAHWARCTCS